MPPPAAAAASTALLLDFDGTLVEFAPTPDAVRADASLRSLLERLQARFGGAVAILSGRPIDALDALLAPLRLPVAGLHGLERRSADGQRHAAPACGPWLAAAQRMLQECAQACPGLLLETKTHGLALHWRRAPQHATAARAAVAAVHARLQPRPLLIEGHAVLELREAGPDKGAALDAFMAEPPFAGRRPLYVGDDVNDFPAQRRALAQGGVAVHVGEPLEGAHAPLQRSLHRLPDPRGVRAWLDSLVGADTT